MDVVGGWDWAGSSLRSGGCMALTSVMHLELVCSSGWEVKNNGSDLFRVVSAKQALEEALGSSC